MTVERQIEAFIGSIWNLSDNTRKCYRLALSSLLSFCEREGIERWQDVDSRVLQAFIGSKRKKGNARNTICTFISCIRAFCRWMTLTGQIERDPTIGLYIPQQKRQLPAYLTVDECTQLLEFDAITPMEKRDKAILELLYGSGLRLSELVGLDVDDLDIAGRDVKVTGKGNKERIQPVGRYAMAALEEWLQCRDQLAGDGVTALFVSQKRRRISPRIVQYIVRKWSTRLLGRAIHPHMLRHSFATHMFDGCNNIRAVQELLGHASLITTQIYTHTGIARLTADYNLFHPRAKRSS